MKRETKLTVRDMAYIGICAVLIAVCSWISIPAMVPFTLQTFGVFLAVGLLGGKRGTLAVLVYILLGAVGVPVFAGFGGGIGYLLGSTGGYIVGFLFQSLVMWAAERLPWKNTLVTVGAMVVGLVACYAFGTVWFMTVYARRTGPVGLWTALGWCVIPYLIPDGIKMALAVLLCGRLKKVLRLD